MRTRPFLSQLLRVRLEDDPQDIAADLLDVAFDAGSPTDKAEAMGQRIDDAFAFSGVVGGVLEGLDDEAAEQLAAVTLALIGQARVRVVEEISAQVEEVEERLRDAGVSEALIAELRGLLRLDGRAA